MQIYGLNKLTLLDYPEHVAAVCFTGGCNMRCPYCHNSDLVLNISSQTPVDMKDFFSFLEKRKGIIDGVVISGGEPTLQTDLIDFIKRIKEYGYLVKLDTNGTNPDVLGKLIDNHLVDYVAMDIKSSLNGYAVSTGVANFDTSLILKSVNLLMNSDIDYEFRTTVCKELHTEAEFEGIADLIRGCNKYFIQSYNDGPAILKDRLNNQKSFPATLTAYSYDELASIVEKLKNQGINTYLRGVKES